MGSWGPTKSERNRRQSKFPRKWKTRFGYGDDNNRETRQSRHNEIKEAIADSIERWKEENDDAD